MLAPKSFRSRQSSTGLYEDVRRKICIASHLCRVHSNQFGPNLMVSHCAGNGLADTVSASEFQRFVAQSSSPTVKAHLLIGIESIRIRYELLRFVNGNNENSGRSWNWCPIRY